ncbi:MAG TPA: hypothetical protein VNZ47_14390 [Candidatus Dormibacteraeota bacterium]|jgi:hypothetical protein|nr:hypothetical protein [Candidatus Dormibacteraeota bacterium]
MKIEREIIVDLLPAYFSGESSAATRTLVEEYFRENPDFEKSARSAGGALESLKVPAPRLDPEKEKLALERARLVTETRSTFLWMAILFTLILGLFRVRDHRIIWVLWEGSAIRGIILSATTIFLWLLYFHARGRKDPVPQRVKFLWIACFYSVLPFLFTLKDHKIAWLFSSEPDVVFIMGGIAIIHWGLYFYHTWKAKSTGL